MTGHTATTRQSVTEPDVLWRPPPEVAATSRLARFQRWLERTRGVATADYEQLWLWSVEHPSRFWAAVWEFFDVRASAPYECVLGGTDMPGAQWFPGARVNYAEQIFANATGDRPALLAVSEGREPRAVSWAELRHQVAALAATLREWGVRPGDRVAGYLPNTPHAVITLLAAASIGAVWACCPPDYGTGAVVDRLRQIEPSVLFAVDGYRYGGKDYNRGEDLRSIIAALPSVQRVVLIPFSPVTQAVPGWHGWDEVTSAPAELSFAPVGFDHPLWILYSSGTTGLPKGIVHGHGGIIVEHLKWLGLHNDVQPGDRFFWHTSTAWMIWYALVSSLLLGATAVLYDGSPGYPGPDAVWGIAAETRAAYFGTSAGHLLASAKAGLRPGRTQDLAALRCIMSTGSPLPIAGWRWVYDAVKPDVWLDAPSGGTDVCTPYVGGCPVKPVVAGEIQCRFLGTRVEAWDEQGRPLTGEVGELVVTAPMPSMPLYFWNDPGGERYRSAYFDVFPGVWRHGDWITITARGTAVIHGRSDSTINRRGVRMGSAEIYAAVDDVEAVTDSLVIGAELPDGGYYMPLFVVLAPGAELDDALRDRISLHIKTTCSARHVPDEIIAVPAIPRTLTGKRLEVPVKRLIQGAALEKVVSAGVVDRPDVLPLFAEAGRRARAASRTGDAR
jgi:acetoacetyl-CoA synthetase